jgi:hypothetical protein
MDTEKLLAPRPLSVPSWLYEETGWCGLTKAATLWWANAICCVFHIVLAIASIIVATLNNRTMATPELRTYLTALSWQPDSTDALIPSFEAAGHLHLAHMVSAGATRGARAPTQLHKLPMPRHPRRCSGSSCSPPSHTALSPHSTFAKPCLASTRRCER